MHWMGVKLRLMWKVPFSHLFVLSPSMQSSVTSLRERSMIINPSIFSSSTRPQLSIAERVLQGLRVSPPCLILLLTSSLPPLVSSYRACFVSGPPAPSKSRAFVRLRNISFIYRLLDENLVLPPRACLIATLIFWNLTIVTLP